MKWFVTLLSISSCSEIHSRGEVGHFEIKSLNFSRSQHI